MIDYSEDRSKKMRVLFARIPPEVFDNCNKFPTLHPSIDCQFPGWCAEIIAYLAEYLNLQIQPVELRTPPNAHVKMGSYSNGTWDGILGLIHNGTVDTACEFYQYTNQRAEHFSFSYPLTSVQLYYMVQSRTADYSSRMWNTFSPYGTSAWVAMCLMLVLQTLYCIGLAKIESRMTNRKHYSVLQIAWKLVRFQLYQPGRFDFVTAAGNFSLLVFAILQCRILMDMYQTLLLSSLLQPPPENPFTSIADMIKMVARKQYQFVTCFKGHCLLEDWYFDEFLHANTTNERSLKAAIGKNVHSVKSVWEAVDLVERGGYILPIIENNIAAIQMRECTNFALLSEGLPQMPIHLVFSKHFRMLPAINKAIVMNRDFIRRTYRKYVKHGNWQLFNDQELFQWQCRKATGANHYRSAFETYNAERDRNFELKPLDLVSMFGVFFLFSVGSALGLLAFLIESSYHQKQQSLFYKQRFQELLLEQVIANPLAVGGLTGAVEDWKERRRARTDRKESRSSRILSIVL